MGTEGKLAALPAVPSTTNNPGYERSPVELLLRAKAHMQRAAAGYGEAAQELAAAAENLQRAREALAGEERSQAVALAAQLAVRSTEARARAEAFGVYAHEVEGWLSRPLPLSQQPTPAEEGGAA